ncbi:MAG: PAS domain S-box protein, partial [Rhodothermales bacterium]|nr:PAS domain S-box protein [Rhodothermales bacterium]
ELYRIFGVDPDEEPITFDSYIGRIVGDDRARVQALIQEALASRNPFSFYHTITRADGEERILRGDGDVVLDAQNGTVLRMYGTAHDVTERRRAEERLRLLEAASSASVDGITIADMTAPDEALVYVSPGFERMTGYAVDEAMGRNCRFLQGDDTGQAAIQEIRSAIAEGRQTRVTLRNYRKDGTLFWNELTLYPLHDATGALTHYVGIQRDVTERRQAQEQLERINRKLEQRNRELQDFAYVASHDLQEPLRKIRAFADLMREDYGATIDEAGRYYLERMQDAAARMSDLIADLLAYSRVTTRAKPFERVDLDRIVAEVLSDLEIQISEVEGTVDVEPLPMLEADPTQMRQVLQNLIGNGLKFHREGERPVVRVWAEVDEGTGYADDAPPRVRIYVRDNGIGFKEKYLDRIFTPFQRLHSRGEYKGTGMGLAICRRIAERHQGTITARSAPGEGATFELTLPLRQPEPQPDPDAT